jgi:hypothetical protein
MFYQIRDGDRPGILHYMSLATIMLDQLRSDSRTTDAVSECGEIAPLNSFATIHLFGSG